MDRKKIAVRVIKEELSGLGFYQNGKEWFLCSDEVVLFWLYKNHHLITSFILILASISIAYQ